MSGYYNPRPLVFNPDSKVIEASGAIGNALYDIFKNNAEMRLKENEFNERKKQNEISNQKWEKQFNQNVYENDRNYGLNREKLDYQKFSDQRDYNYKVAQHRQAVARANARAYQSAINQRQKDYENGMFAYQWAKQNGYAPKDEMTPEKQAEWGNAFTKQMEYGEKFNKAYGSQIQAQKQAEQEQIQNKNLAMGIMGDENLRNSFGFDESDMKAFNDVMQNGTPEQIAFMSSNVTRLARDKAQARKELQNLGGDVGITLNQGSKNLPVDTLKSIRNAQNNIQGLTDYYSALKNADGRNIGLWDSLGGSLAYDLGIPSKENAELVAKSKNVAYNLANSQKGNANKTIQNFQDELTPYRISGGKLNANVVGLIDKELINYENAINDATIQGNYKGAKELQQQLYNIVENLPPEVRNQTSFYKRQNSQTQQSLNAQPKAIMMND